ncbi:MAG: NAD(P)/FAD-dependent oxidoreductase [Deltaproteobacteria bacterium]|nr:NAD(P)/FAD-dependent oxidoreductase [Deltaproteobacteria bacterium]
MSATSKEIKNKYEVVVIGGGIGGLVAATILAKNGLSVAVLEKNNYTGGVLSSFEKDGCIFDNFGTYIYGAGFAEPMNFLRQTFSLIGINPEILPVEPPMQVFTPDKSLTLYRDKKEFLRELNEYFPSFRREINEFYSELEELYEILLEIPHYRPMGRFSVLKTAIFHPHLSEKLIWNSFNTLNSLYKKFGFSEELKSIFSNIVAHFTLLKPYEVPAFIAAYFLIGIHREGLYYTKGTNANLIKEIVKEAQSSGVSIFTDSEVKEIFVSNNYARGVILSTDRVIHADRVISNTTAYRTFTKLIDRKYLSDNVRHSYDVIENADSFFYLYLKTEKETIKHLKSPNILYIPKLSESYDKSGIVRIFVPSMLDSSLVRGRSHHNVIISTPQDIPEWKDKRHAEKKKEAITEKLLNILNNIIPGIREGSTVVKINSPCEIEEITGREGGTFGRKMDFRQGLYNRGGNKAALENLYLAGDSTFPGQGIAMAAYSGKLCAELIIRERGKKLPI